MAIQQHIKLLDFLVIGAAKSGTTSLHHYLRTHPQIYLPDRKELPFFTKHKDWYEAGWAAFVAQFYAQASPDALWGKVTPQYMAEPHVPQTIYEMMPEVKLIALLRHPVDRTFSYYNMLARRGKETRTFETVMNQQLKPDAIIKARQTPMGGKFNYNTYLVRSEYGRILSYYRDCFPPEQLFILFTDDLKKKPQIVIDKILAYLGLSPGFVPPNLTLKYNASTEGSLYPFSKAIQSIPPIRWLWRGLVPSTRREALRNWGEQKLRAIRNQTNTFSPELRARLIDFYRPDVACLETLLGDCVPWAEFRE